MNKNKIEEILTILSKYILAEDFLKLTFTKPLYKENKYFKIVLEKKMGEESKFFQFSYFYETKVKQSNYSTENEILEVLSNILNEKYGRCQLMTSNISVELLINKNFNYKLITKETDNSSQILERHNRTKSYILPEGIPVPWLVELGIMNKEGFVVKDKQKKFRQINKFLEIINDVSKYIPNNPTIIDFGCGKSYLTFALYYYLTSRGDENVKIIGLDLKKDVIENCNNLSKKFRFDGLNFLEGNIELFSNKDTIADMIVTLHACDTATDYALYNAINWNCKVVLSVPCCQHELFNMIENDDMKPFLKYGLLKERFSALLTDSLRANMLEVFGYKCQILEFADMEFTAKNIMIKAVKQNNKIYNKKAFEDFCKLKNLYKVNPKIWELCSPLLDTSR